MKKNKNDFWRINAYITNAKTGKWEAWVDQHNYIKGGKHNAILYALHLK